jgi:hypothetical protein
MKSKSPLYRRVEDGKTVVRAGKHPGKTLEEVRRQDPTFLWWLWEKNSDELSQEMFEELTDLLKESGMWATKFDKEKKGGRRGK